MSSMWGNNIKISIFGESHSSGIGVVLDGIPAGEQISYDELYAFMAKRRSNGVTDTPRIEKDIPEIISGIVDGVTCGTPICAVIKNQNTHSSDYEQLRETARPGHADYTGYVRYNGFNDIRGGGHFSGRLTAPLVFAGGICRQILSRKGIEIGAHISRIAENQDDDFDMASISCDELKSLQNKPFPVLNESIKAKMIDDIKKISEQKNSIGGVVQCAVIGIKAGIGSPMFDNVESKLASMMFSIPAIKGIEFGKGFDVAKMTGYECNDSFYTDGEKILTKTNNNGGILGGITNGMPVVFKVAIKPTSSIGMKQETVNFVKKENTVISVKGRHDPCIVRRAVPCIEAGTAVAILDMIL